MNTAADADWDPDQGTSQGTGQRTCEAAETTPDQWGAIASLTAHTASREHPDLWAATGLPDCLSNLEVAVETVWAAVQLALSGADHITLADTLALTDNTARRIIIATTEQLLTRDSPHTH
jgi:hypothetical protein